MNYKSPLQYKDKSIFTSTYSKVKKLHVEIMQA